MSDGQTQAYRSEKNFELITAVSRAEAKFLANPTRQNFESFQQAIKTGEREVGGGYWGESLHGASEWFEKIYGKKKKEIKKCGKAKISSTDLAQFILRNKGEPGYTPILNNLAYLMATRENKKDIFKRKEEIVDDMSGKITLKYYDEIQKKINRGELKGEDIELILKDYVTFPLTPVE